MDPRTGDGVAGPPDVLFRDVRVLDTARQALGPPTSVLLREGVIAAIGPAAQAADGATIVEGRGRTLMPGLIDVHVHLTFGALTMEQLLAPDLTPAAAEAAAAEQARRMLLRGFTAVRDVGGPVFALKDGIDAGRYEGPRIWPSGATVSQTAGHGDFRLPSERSRRPLHSTERPWTLSSLAAANARAARMSSRSRSGKS